MTSHLVSSIPSSARRLSLGRVLAGRGRRSMVDLRLRRSARPLYPLQGAPRRVIAANSQKQGRTGPVMGKRVHDRTLAWAKNGVTRYGAGFLTAGVAS